MAQSNVFSTPQDPEELALKPRVLLGHTEESNRLKTQQSGTHFSSKPHWETKTKTQFKPTYESKQIYLVFLRRKIAFVLITCSQVMSRDNEIPFGKPQTNGTHGFGSTL